MIYQTDARLGMLMASLKQHHESAQLLAREVPLLADTVRSLAVLKSQADELRPLLASLDQLYSQLAASDVRWLPDLVERESEFRHSRHVHYRQLQSAMDEQYADLRRQSVSTRAANAERSFQRDLENYHQRQSSPLRVHRPSPGVRELADVVLAPNAWVRDDEAASGFFSDDDGAGANAGQANGSETTTPPPPGVTVLGDDDFV
ncbi:hypothetical protein GGI20_001867 [Coemansia sp. BCRC 34301]|nr:hypothetical protein GGI20_001867 [Coemansia sp. BCRC 34301]